MKMRCGQCGQESELPEVTAGTAAKCPACGHALRGAGKAVESEAEVSLELEEDTEPTPPAFAAGPRNAVGVGQARQGMSYARQVRPVAASRVVRIDLAPEWLAAILPLVLYIVAAVVALIGFILGIVEAAKAQGDVVAGLYYMLLSLTCGVVLFTFGFLAAVICDIRSRLAERSGEAEEKR